jgi:heme A synthase
LTTAVVYGQLTLGAIVRHTGAGLAIPDFPLAFGGLWPPLEEPAVVIHFLHRLGAVGVTVCIAWTLSRVIRHHRAEAMLLRPAIGIAGLLLLELTLGALTIWTERAVLPTTGHVAVGAAILATSFLLTLRSYGLLASPRPRVHRGWVSEQVPA